MSKFIFIWWLLKGNIVPNQDHNMYRFSFDEDVVCSYMTKEEMVVYMKETIEGSDIIDEEEFYLNN